MKYKSFSEWKEIGYHVVNGEKSIKKREDGVCLFSSKQVQKTIQPSLEELAEIYLINESDLY